MSSERYPISPRTEIDGLPYLPRLCDKVRLFAAGELHPDFHSNLGKGMDLWICQFFGVDYEEIKSKVLSGADDAETLAYLQEKGTTRPDYEHAWFISYLTSRGYRDDLSERLAQRKAESGFADRADICTFFDYLDADEGRL